MSLFVGLVSMTLIIGFLNKNFIVSKKNACVLVSIYAIALFGLRDKTIGNVDVPIFVNNFNSLLAQNMFEVFEAHKNKDLVFYLVSKLFSLVSSSYTAWFFAIGTLFISSFSILIYKYSKNITFSYILFYTLLFTLNFSLLRHCCALAMVIFTYISLHEKRYGRAIVCGIIAILFHISALVIVFYPLLKRFKFGLKNIIVIATVFIIPFVIPNLLTRIVQVIRISRFENYRTGDVSTLTLASFVIYFLLFIWILYLIYINKKDTLQTHSLELNMITTGLCLYALVGILAEFYRMAMFFSFIIVIILPNLMQKITKDNNGNYIFIQIAKVIIYILMILRLFLKILPVSGLVPYIFFWE